MPQTNYSLGEPVTETSSLPILPEVNKASDLDLMELFRNAPKDATIFQLRGILEGAEIVLDRKNSSACVFQMFGGRPTIYLNPDFLNQYVDNYHELFLLVFHEMTHVIVGHFVMDKLKVMFKDPWWTTPEGTKVKLFCEEMLVHHIEHMALIDDSYHTLNEKVFRPLGEPQNIFFRGTPKEEIEDILHQALHDRIVSDGRYSVREAANTIRLRIQNDEEYQLGENQNPMDNIQVVCDATDNSSSNGSNTNHQERAGSTESQKSQNDEQSVNQDQQEDGSDGGLGEDSEDSKEEEGGDGESKEGSSSSGEPSSGKGGGGEEEGEGEEGGGGTSGGSDALDEEDGEEGGKSKGDDGEDLEDESGNDESDDSSGPNSQKGNGNSHGETSGADENGLEALMDALSGMLDAGKGTGGSSIPPELREEIMERRSITNLPTIIRATQKVLTRPGILNRVAKIFREKVGFHQDYSIIPDIRKDRRAAARLAAGIYVPYFRRQQMSVESKFTLYFDISGSQHPYIPICIDLISSLKSYVDEAGVNLFSDYVVPLRLPQFFEAVRENPRLSQHSSYGTSFDRVAEDIIAKKLKKVVIITDNVDHVRGRGVTNMDTFKKSGGYLLVLQTGINTSWPGFNQWADHTELILAEDLTPQ